MLSRRTLLFAPLVLRAAPRPNVVIFLSDDMGAADLSSYGSPDIRTPAIDSLARDGVKFTDCYANGPVCTPTRCGLLTGRYQQRAGLEWALMPADRPKGLDAARDVTLPRVFRDAGYRTAMFGKWHLGWEKSQTPVAHGFEEFFGILSGNVDMYSHRRREDTADLWEGDAPVERTGYLTDLIRDRAIQWLGKVKGEPFFLYVPFNAVHWPFNPPGDPTSRRNADNWTDGTRREYKLMTESMDAAVGAVLRAIETNGQARDTLVIFTNDNGGERYSDNRPFFHHKGTLFEGGIRVPGLMRFPGRLRPGSVSSQVAASMDFGVTALGAAGLNLPRRPDGIDLMPALLGQARPPERALCWRIRRRGRRQSAIRRGNWKYLLDGDINMLCDLAKDPGERTDLFMHHEDVAIALRREFQAWEKDLESTPPPFPPVV